MTVSLLDFLNSYITPEQLVKLRKASGNSNIKGDLTVGEAIEIVQECQNEYFTKDFSFLPNCVDHDRSFDTDHDHGAWTERFVFNDYERYLAVEVEFWGQGDYDNKDIEMYEVKPREITTIFYDTI